jgi:hypothetical protein
LGEALSMGRMFLWPRGLDRQLSMRNAPTIIVRRTKK